MQYWLSMDKLLMMVHYEAFLVSRYSFITVVLLLIPENSH